MKNNLTKYLTEFSNLKLTRPISDKVRCLEIFGVVLTGTGKFVFVDYLNWRLSFVLVTIILWSAYVFFRFKKDKHALKDWGFRTDNFKSISKFLLPFVVISMILFWVIGYLQGTINLTWHIIPLLITYPIWGSIQQFLTIALLAGNLKDLKAAKINKTLIIFITAVFFSIIHYPVGWLMAGTFVLALFYGYIYLKVKNIYALGMVHGWLGAIFYYTVVNQDPFADVFLKFVNQLL
ncbi:MAG: CPBP family intramembrane metalloprotease [Winogradskyella sp.]|uniref:CPBP family intramembrane glutamic endopeptidase n=1 Tax=Winogradskyella sp. TaxID=1883156 RepID=UPI0025DE5993|nr:CPBP family intramembrane glutamic endopeptidase [Winogradskyella sp.]NRB83720.1 CPBP family intramembrane metalloprotease [Winogradskyella sp.]